MKHFLKALTTLKVLFFVTLVGLIGCEKEGPVEADKVAVLSGFPAFKITEINNVDISRNSELLARLNRFNKNQEAGRASTSSRDVHNPGLDFIVNTSVANYLEYGNYHSYTFMVERDMDNGLTENLLLSLQGDGSYLAYLISYDITEEEKELLRSREAIDLKGNVGYTLITDDDWVNTAFSRTGDPELCLEARTITPRCNYTGQHTAADIENGTNGGHNCAQKDLGVEQPYTVLYLTECGGGGGGAPDGSLPNNGSLVDDYGNPYGNVGGDGTGADPNDPSPDPNDPTNDGEGPVEDNNNCLQLDANGDCVEDVTTPVLLDVDEAKFNNFKLTLSSEAQIWLADHPEEEANIFDYFKDNGFTDETEAFAIEVIKAEISGDFSDLFLLDIFTQDPYDVWGKLTEAEKTIIRTSPFKAYKIYKNRPIAETETINKFGANGLNDKSDAFRHAYFQAINSRDVGFELAGQLSDAHESEVPTRWILEKNMDLFNNEYGLVTGYNNPNANNQAISNLIYQAITNGDLVYLFPIDYTGYTISGSPFWDNPITPEPKDGHHGITVSTTITPTNQ